MLKLCGDSIWKPLEIIFNNCLKEGIFPDEWKKANVVPIHKKMINKSYLIIDLFPSFQFVDIWTSNVWFNVQTCKRSITYDIFQCFDEGMETRAIFLDISKAFDKVWRKGLIYELHQYGFTGKLLTLLTDFLSNRKQRIVLKGQHSSWADIKAGAPQDSILGPLLSLVYVND